MGKSFNSQVVVVLCAAWVLGLLAALVPYRWGGIALGGVALAALALALAGLALGLPLLRRWGLVWWVWLLAGGIALLAGFYLQWRTPQPGPQDISRKAPEFDVVVTGKALNLPRLNSSGKRRFFLEAQQMELGEAPYTRAERVTGKLYVTVAPDQAEGITPGRKVSIKGDVYLPVTAAFQGGFDFKNYLAQNDTFAGMRGEEVYFTDPTGQGTWGFWRLRQKIVDVHTQALGALRGPLVSAMVVGARVVDLDGNLRTAFTRAGLAHTIAASGFHVSLLLGTVLALTNRLGLRTQMLAGLGALGLFVMLAGFEAGVARASLMGAVGLWGLVQTGEGDVTGKRQPLHLLLLVAAVLLLYNPNWIGNLGFQFSFLATLGLMLLATPIAQSLTFLPPALAELIAVPTAAYLWTLPLQLYSIGHPRHRYPQVNLIHPLQLQKRQERKFHRLFIPGVDHPHLAPVLNDHHRDSPRIQDGEFQLGHAIVQQGHQNHCHPKQCHPPPAPSPPIPPGTDQPQQHIDQHHLPCGNFPRRQGIERQLIRPGDNRQQSIHWIG